MTRICRLCLLSSSSNTFQKATTINQECFTTVLPEISLRRIESSLICGKCIESLHSAYLFKIKCLETEGIIKDYYKGEVPNIGNKALRKVLSWKKQKIVETPDKVVTQGNEDPEHNNTNNVASEIDRVQCLDIEELNVREEVIKRHSEKYRYVSDCFLQCDICNNWFYSKNELLEHVGSHFGVKCQYCDKYFKDSINLKKHGRESHQFKIENCYSCDICCQWYIDKNKLLRHVLLHFEKPGCKICSETFDNTLNLKEHLLSKHDITIDFSKNSNEDLLELDNVYFEVDHAELMKNILRHLEKYREVENDDTQFICEVCNKNFDTENSLNNHLKLHFCRPKCFRCDRSFYNSQSLKRHISNEHCTVIKVETACDENQNENRTETDNIIENGCPEFSKIMDIDDFEYSNIAHIQDFEHSMVNNAKRNESFTNLIKVKIEPENDDTPVEHSENSTNFNSYTATSIKEEMGTAMFTVDEIAQNSNTGMPTDITNSQSMEDIDVSISKRPKKERNRTKLHKWVCKTCEEEFESKASLCCHFRTHNSIMENRKCIDCNNTFLCGKAWGQHRKWFPKSKFYKCPRCRHTSH